VTLGPLSEKLERGDEQSTWLVGKLFLLWSRKENMLKSEENKFFIKTFLLTDLETG